MDNFKREEHLKLVSSGVKWRGKRISVPSHEAEDVVHDAYVIYLDRNLSREEEMHVCLFEACKLYHRNSRLQGMSDPLGQDLLSEDANSQVEGHLWQEIKGRKKLWHRQALALHFIQGHPIRDVCDMLDVNYKSVEMLFHRFTEDLKGVVDDRDSL